MTDPRKAETLGEAAMNTDGTYNAFKALSWLSEVIRPGRGMSKEEIRKTGDEVIAERRTKTARREDKQP